MITNQHNAVLVFKRIIPQTITNQYLEPSTTVEDYYVYLSIEEGSIKELKSDAQRKDLISCDGRLIKPRQLPSEFRTQRQAKITILQSLNLPIPLSGIAYIKPQISSRMGLESWFGEYIQLDLRFD
jgi:hypothetical protein